MFPDFWRGRRSEEHPHAPDKTTTAAARTEGCHRSDDIRSCARFVGLGHFARRGDSGDGGSGNDVGGGSTVGGGAAPVTAGAGAAPGAEPGDAGGGAGGNGGGRAGGEPQPEAVRDAVGGGDPRGGGEGHVPAGAADEASGAGTCTRGCLQVS